VRESCRHFQQLAMNNCRHVRRLGLAKKHSVLNPQKWFCASCSATENVWVRCIDVTHICTWLLFRSAVFDEPRLVTSQMWCSSGGSGIIKLMSLSYSNVYHYGAQWYEQFILIGRLDWALVLLGLALCLVSIKSCSRNYNV